jgi:hypothetical protein
VIVAMDSATAAISVATRMARWSILGTRTRAEDSETGSSAIVTETEIETLI